MSEIPSPIAYNISICLHEGEIASEDFALFGPGASARALRRFDDGGLRSAVVDLPAGWRSSGPLRIAGAVQFLVREGRLTLGDRIVGAHGFVVVPRGGVLPVMTSDVSAQILLICDDSAAPLAVTDGDDAHVTADVFSIEPIIPVIAGKRLEGFERRVLWEDAETGGDTRLLRIPAGFEGAAGPNFHPVQEEIFCLEGDIAPDDSRPMRAGSFLWNQKLAVHGFREHSQGGCVLLEWHDGPWAFHVYDGVPVPANEP